jgi:hypothetical protein
VGLKAGTKPTEPLTATSLAHIVQEAKSIALVDRSPSTVVLTQGLEKLGVAAQLQAKTRIYPTGGAIAEALSRAKVDVGITTMSELVSVATSNFLVRSRLISCHSKRQRQPQSPRIRWFRERPRL